MGFVEGLKVEVENIYVQPTQRPHQNSTDDFLRSNLTMRRDGREQDLTHRSQHRNHHLLAETRDNFKAFALGKQLVHESMGL